MAAETPTAQRSDQERSAELNALSWTFSNGSTEKMQEVLERLLWTPVPRIQQIGLDTLIKMGKNSPHASQTMEQIFDIISKRAGMFSVFSSGGYEVMSSLISGLSALGGKSLDNYGIFELLGAAQKNDEASIDIIDELEELTKKVLLYYWKVFSRNDIKEMKRLIRKLRLTSPNFLTAIKIWNLYDAAQKNPHAPQDIKKILSALKNKEKSVREKKGSAEAKKRAQEDLDSLLAKKPKSRRSGAAYRSLQGPNKEKLQQEYEELEKAIAAFEELEETIVPLMMKSSVAIAKCCDKIQDEQQRKLAQRIKIFCENYTKLRGSQANLEKEKVKTVIIKYSTQKASINSISLLTKLIAELDDYNHKKVANHSHQKRKAEIENFLF